MKQTLQTPRRRRSRFVVAVVMETRCPPPHPKPPPEATAAPPSEWRNEPDEAPLAWLDEHATRLLLDTRPSGAALVGGLLVRENTAVRSLARACICLILDVMAALAESGEVAASVVKAFARHIEGSFASKAVTPTSSSLFFLLLRGSGLLTTATSRTGLAGGAFSPSEDCSLSELGPEERPGSAGVSLA